MNTLFTMRYRVWLEQMGKKHAFGCLLGMMRLAINALFGLEEGGLVGSDEAERSFGGCLSLVGLG